METARRLAALVAALLDDDRLADPGWTRTQHWERALPNRGPANGADLRSLESAGLYCLGDWLEGEGRIGAAVRSGLEASDRLLGRAHSNRTG